MSTEPKPCPFCGNELGASPIGYRGGSHCVTCGCSATGPVQVTEPEALKKWQHRPLEDKQAARIRELEEQLEEAGIVLRAANRAYYAPSFISPESQPTMNNMARRLMQYSKKKRARRESTKGCGGGG